MDRGFGGSYRGNFGGNNAPNYRNASDRRYDDFYSDNRRGGAAGFVSRNNNINRNRNGNNVANWGGSNRDRGFFNQGGQGGAAPRSRGTGGNVGGQMLAALQQQQNLLNAFMSSQSRGLLPSPNNSYNENQGGSKFGGRGGGRFSGRPGDKRKQDSGYPSGFNKRKRPQTNVKKDPYIPKQQDTRLEKKEEPVKINEVPKEEEIDIPDEEVDIPDSLMDSVEKLRQRKEFERNVADEDVEKLVVFCFTGKGYQCLTCGLLLMKESAFVHHLMGKSHVMNVIDARTAKKYQITRDILDIDLSPDDWYEKNEKARAIILKQAKMFMKTQREIQQREKENYNKNPANFFRIKMETRKAAIKSGDVVTIKSLVESTIEVKEFDGDKFFGCEFIKAVSSFHCRLCGLHIKEPVGVVPHIESRLHKSNYQVHLKKTEDYEKTQKHQNKELCDILQEHENKYVLLAESENVEEGTFLSAFEEQLVRVPKLLEGDNDGKEGADDKQSNKEMKSDETNNETDQLIADEKQEEKEEDKPTVDEKDGEEEQPVDEPSVDDDDQVVKKEDISTEEVVGTGEEQTVEQTETKPKSILKKSGATRGRGGTTKRGRGRGKVTPSPRSRGRKTKDEEEFSQEDSNDGSFMDGFQVVDEVDE